MRQTKQNQKEESISKKVWYIIVENRQEGPYSILDLRKDRRFTPDTLIWRKGFKEWVAARKVAEIADAFKDEPPSKPLQEPVKEKKLGTDFGQENPATLTLHQDPYQLILWILVVLLILFYAFYQFFNR